MRNVAVVGIGMTKFGELWDYSLRDIFTMAAIEAMDDAGCSTKDIEAFYVGSMSAGRFVGQEHLGALLADYAGLKHVPATRVEGACASGGLALREAYLAIKAGEYDVVMVGGIEKMSDLPTTEEVTTTLGAAADQEWETFVGLTFPGAYALIAKVHMERYGTTREQLACVAVKNHKNGKNNPKAQFRREITIEQVLSSGVVADPLTLLDCSPISDGGAVAIVASEDVARKFTDTPVWIMSSGQAGDTIALHDRKDLTSLTAAKFASERAYRAANIGPKDVAFAEVHDCFTIAEIVATEDLGFFPAGEGGKAAEEGLTEVDGQIPVNPSGGLKAKGHPVGATGVAQVVSVVEQLRGEADKRQVNAPEIGLTHNIGGSGGTCVVHIFSR
ncbi:MAG: thiolase domain-containing protein [Candidatus Hodarchaeota archaeon]